MLQENITEKKWELATHFRDSENTKTLEREVVLSRNWLVRKFPGIFLDASSLVKYFEYQRRYSSPEHTQAPLLEQLDETNKQAA